jgi:hypothetical protein
MQGPPTWRQVGTFRPVAALYAVVATGLTLAFELAALRRLDDPGSAVADARRWSEHVGVVTDEPPYVLTKFVRDHEFRNDFPAEPAPANETLDHMRTHHDTERYVLVITADSDRSAPGWERLPVGEAAESAGWELSPEDEGGDSTPGALDDASDWP